MKTFTIIFFLFLNTTYASNTDEKIISLVQDLYACGAIDNLLENNFNNDCETITEYLVCVDKGMPSSGFTWFEKNGFHIGREAFTSIEEMIKTFLHELFRLNHGESGYLDVDTAATRTLSAFEFAEEEVDTVLSADYCGTDEFSMLFK
ncbi:MAG: hypothetical protein H6621_06400 [Halobacteriovoraceae bacterium]|nr:hypothetical protein [Halobacteriovoraceae bacterium]